MTEQRRIRRERRRSHTQQDQPELLAARGDDAPQEDRLHELDSVVTELVAEVAGDRQRHRVVDDERLYRENVQSTGQ